MNYLQNLKKKKISNVMTTAKKWNRTIQIQTLSGKSQKEGVRMSASVGACRTISARMRRKLAVPIQSLGKNNLKSNRDEL